MTYQIHITRTAERDLNATVDYIDHSLKNPYAADSPIRTAESKIGSLASFPEKFSLVDDPVLASCGIRFVIIKNYLAFYIIDKPSQTVHILRFLHGKSDWHSILKGK